MCFGVGRQGTSSLWHLLWRRGFRLYLLDSGGHSSKQLVLRGRYQVQIEENLPVRAETGLKWVSQEPLSRSSDKPSRVWWFLGGLTLDSEIFWSEFISGLGRYTREKKPHRCASSESQSREKYGPVLFLVAVTLVIKAISDHTWVFQFPRS